MQSQNHARRDAQDSIKLLPPGHLAPCVPQQPQALSNLVPVPAPVVDIATSNLALFERALDVVPAGPLYRSIKERLERMRNADSDQQPIDVDKAYRHIDDISRKALIECMEMAFSDTKYYWMSVGRGLRSNDLESGLSINGQSDPQVREFARSLLDRGDNSEVAREASAYATYLFNVSHFGALLPPIGGLGAFISACMNPAVSSFQALALGLGAYGALGICNEVFGRRNHMGAGRLLENMDAVKTLRAGRPSSLHEPIQEYFLNLGDCSSGDAMVRADSFLIARTLRILGTPDRDIRQAFRETSSVEVVGNSLISLLQEKMATADLRLTEDFLIRMYLDNPSKEQLATRETLDLLHQVHFAGELWDNSRAREELARQILAAVG